MNGDTRPVGPGEWLDIDGVAHRCVTLCFLFRTRDGVEEVLLGLKRTGFGAGRIVALGGKIDGSETALDAAVREVAEESSIRLEPGELEAAGRVTWSFPAAPRSNMTAFLFTADVGAVTARTTEEIEPHWYTLDAIPWDGMWQDARHWLPVFLADRVVDARIVMAGDNQGVASVVVGGEDHGAPTCRSSGPS